MSISSRLFSFFLLFLLVSNIMPFAAADSADENKSSGVDYWKIIELSIPQSNGRSEINVELLRPLSWIEENNARVNGVVHLVLEEMGIDDWFTCISINPYQPIESPDGGVVITGRFESNNSALVEITFIDSDEQLTCTSNHRFFSIRRNEWVTAKDLLPGEHIQTQTGSRTIKSITSWPGSYKVYNIEVVDEAHSYYVSSDNILTHNACFEGRGIADTNMVIGAATERGMFTKKGVERHIKLYNEYPERTVDTDFIDQFVCQQEKHGGLYLTRKTVSESQEVLTGTNPYNHVGTGVINRLRMRIPRGFHIAKDFDMSKFSELDVLVRKIGKECKLHEPDDRIIAEALINYPDELKWFITADHELVYKLIYGTKKIHGSFEKTEHGFIFPVQTQTRWYEIDVVPFGSRLLD